MKSSHQPPRWIRSVLARLLDPRTLEASLGDLEEKFFRHLGEGMPLWKTKWKYIAEAVGFVKMTRRTRPIAGPATLNVMTHSLMFFFRLVKRDKSYYAISVLGLAVSLGSADELILSHLFDLPGRRPGS